MVFSLESDCRFFAQIRRGRWWFYFEINKIIWWNQHGHWHIYIYTSYISSEIEAAYRPLHLFDIFLFFLTDHDVPLLHWRSFAIVFVFYSTSSVINLQSFQVFFYLMLPVSVRRSSIFYSYSFCYYCYWCLFLFFIYLSEPFDSLCLIELYDVFALHRCLYFFFHFNKIASSQYGIMNRLFKNCLFDLRMSINTYL